MDEGEFPDDAVSLFRVQLRLYKRHPAWGFRDPVTHAWEPVYGVHYSVAAATAVGARYAYDIGVQRHCWLVNLLTNWIGDEGWLKSCNAQYRRFVYQSDAVWFRGIVTKKYVDGDGEYCVDIETHGINQRGEDTIPGHSTVILPSRKKGPGLWRRDCQRSNSAAQAEGSILNHKNWQMFKMLNYRG